jgi:hypothetical protein
VKLLSTVQDYLIAIVIGAIGGLTRVLSTKDKKLMKWTNLLSELVVSGFVGFLVAAAIQAGGFDPKWLGFLSGIFGFAGAVGVRVLSEKFGLGALNKKDEKETKK